MNIAFALALFFMIWFITLFAVLPFGVRTQAEAGEVVPGTPASAPSVNRLRKVFMINTVVAAVVFCVVWAALGSDWFGYVPPPLPPGATGP